MTAGVKAHTPRRPSSVVAHQRHRPSAGRDVVIALLTFLAVAGAVVYATLPRGLPSPQPTTTPPTTFSSARALEHVRAVARSPHPTGSRANAAVRDYLMGELTALGLRPQVQKADVAHRFAHAIVAGTPENVLARLEGTGDSDKAFLLMAHYDSVPVAPGAGDDGAGVAAILETVRAVRAGPSLRNDVIVLFTDGEEQGLLGARAFADRHPWAADVGVVLNLEARGHTGAAYLLRTNDDNGWIISQFAKAAPYPFATSDTSAYYELAGAGSDLAVALDAGWAGMDVAFVEGLPTYHTAQDTADRLDPRTLQHLGSNGLALTRRFGNVPLDRPRAPDAVYFNLFGRLIHYPQEWTIPLATSVALAFAGVVALGVKRRQLNVRGIAGGALVLLAGMTAAAVGAHLLWLLIRVLRPGDAIWALEYKHHLLYIGFASLSVAVAATLIVGFRPKIGSANLTFGALLWWLLLTVLTSVWFPPVSYAFTWPLLSSLVGVGAVFLAGDRPAGPWIGFAALTLTAVPALVLAVPNLPVGVTTIDGLFLPLVVPIFALEVVLVLGLVIPHLGLMAQPKPWAVPTTAAVVGLATLATGTLAAGFDADHPKPNSIFYALNADSQQAIWASNDQTPDAWTAQFLGADATSGDVSDVLPTTDPLLHGSAPSAALDAPSIKLLADNVQNERRTLHLRVAAPTGADRLLLAVDAGARITGTAVDERQVPLRAPGDDWTLHYRDPPAEGIALELQLRGTQPLTLHATAVTPGLPDLPGESHRARTPETIAGNRDSFAFVDSTVTSRALTVTAPGG